MVVGPSPMGHTLTQRPRVLEIPTLELQGWDTVALQLAGSVTPEKINLFVLPGLFSKTILLIIALVVTNVLMPVLMFLYSLHLRKGCP